MLEAHVTMGLAGKQVCSLGKESTGTSIYTGFSQKQGDPSGPRDAFSKTQGRRLRCGLWSQSPETTQEPRAFAE